MSRLLSGARTRVLLAILVLLVASEAVALVAGRQILLARTGERVDDALTQEVGEFRRLVRDGRDPLNQGRPFAGDVRRIFDVFLARNLPGEGEAIFTFLRDRPYRSSVGDPGGAAFQRELRRLGATATTRRGEIETQSGEARYLAVPVLAEGERRGAFVVTVDLAGERAEVNDVLRVTATVSSVVLLLAGLVAWLVAGRLLAPIRQLTDTARSITESDLTRRIDVRGTDEVSELARTFNGMLDRLEVAFGSQRAFVSDAGHELRTPITIIRGHLELLGDDPREREETVELVTDELDRMSRFVEDLLTLAKAERTDFLRLEDVDLDALTQELMAKASALAPRDWRLAEIGAGRLRADRHRLTQAVMNLAANAVQHTADGDRVDLGSRLDDGRARLWVADSGPGVAAADRDRIFERFARAEGAPRRSEGAGLGLSIVRAIAEAHGGTVRLESRAGGPGDLGTGATFILDLPTEPPAEVSSP